MAVLSDEQVNDALSGLAGWERVDNAVRRSVKFPAFLEGIDAVRRVETARNLTSYISTQEEAWLVLAARGLALIVISSEMQELIGLAHRILVMRAGRIVAELEGEDMTEDRIVIAATGAAGEAA